MNLRAGEYASTAATRAPLILGNIDEVQVRADVDEQLAPRVKAGQKAVGYVKGDTAHPMPLEFVRISELPPARLAVPALDCLAPNYLTG